MKNRTILCVFAFGLLLNTLNAQVPNHITRTTNISASTVRDSAQKSITLLPNFEFTSTSGKYYEAKITGILPSTPGTVTLDWPKGGQVYQRNNSNQGWVYVTGSVSDANLLSVRVQATPVQGGAPNQKILNVSGSGGFEGAIQLMGGDYNITVHEHMDAGGIKSPAGNVVANRVGVGEVLLLMGFSYMEGGQPVPDTDPKISRAALDERVRTVPSTPFNPNTDNVEVWKNSQPYVFHKIVENVGPMVSNSWAYGFLGDDLVSRLNVPVLIYSAAFGGTSIYHHERNIANDVGFGSGWFAVWAQKGFPHQGVRAAIEKYIPKTGLRAMLIHHGGNDRPQINDFTTNFNIVFNDIKSRLNNFNDLSLFIALDGPYADHPANDPSIGFVNQINNIISSNSHYYAGANVNGAVGSYRLDEGTGCGNCGHFANNNAGLEAYGNLWKSALPTGSFSSITFKEADIDPSLKL